jgi:predicted branched-subunit amino acid permease
MGNSGLSPAVMVLMSLLVFAGSAQLAVLPLLSSGAPLPVVWATALCVNLRFIVFSTQWRPYFIGEPLPRRLALSYFSADLNLLLFMRRYPQPRPEPGQWAYFWGGAALTWVAWQVPSLVGILAAASVPTQWGIGFAGTLALLGIACSMFTDRAAVACAGVAGCAAVAAYALPLKLNILVAIAAAVAMGLMLDHVKSQRPAPWRGTN